LTGLISKSKNSLARRPEHVCLIEGKRNVSAIGERRASDRQQQAARGGGKGGRGRKIEPSQ